MADPAPPSGPAPPSSPAPPSGPDPTAGPTPGPAPATGPAASQGAPAGRRGVSNGPLGAGFGFFAGVRLLLRGLGMYARSPRLMLLGLIPAVISAAVLVAGVVAMVYFVDDLAVWATPFADGWADSLRDATRALAVIAIAGVSIVLSILVFTALTLLIGQPFYEAISKRVEDQLGGVPNEINVSFWRTLPRSIFDSVRLILFGAIFGVAIFLIGLIPVAGQVAAPILGAMLGGWVLAVELTSVPFERRGLRLRDRRRALRSRRFTSLGFGVATFLCFLVPLGAVLVMPAAVAGATLLSRRLLGLPDRGR